MTGRDLIIYILANDLENEPIIKDGTFLGFITAKQAAVKFSVGEATIKVWVGLDMLDGVTIGDELYIPAHAEVRIDKRN